MSLHPFTISIPQHDIDDLKQRLTMTRWTEDLAGAGWDYGIDLAYLKEIAAYWRTEYDWRAQESGLNRFAQFKADIDGFKIHFIHERGTGTNPIPVLLMHGWPSTFYQMIK